MSQAMNFYSSELLRGLFQQKT